MHRADLAGVLRWPGLHALGLAVLTWAVWTQHGVDTWPIERDRAYFTYLGQALERGEPIYERSFMGYPPVGPLVASASMRAGAWLGVPSYLAPRYAAVVFGIASVVGIAELARRATASDVAGLCAGVTLAGFGYLRESALSTLEPKLLVILFGVFASLLVQKRAWGSSGVFASFAASCWQPAALIPLTTGALALFRLRSEGRRPLVRHAVGLVVGALPACVYLSATSSWLAFWQRAVVIPASLELSGAAGEPLRWLDVAWSAYPFERWFFLAALFGFLTFAMESYRRGSYRSGRSVGIAAWLDPRLGGVPVATLSWMLWNTVEFGNAPDLLPFLPWVSFWVAWLVARLERALRPACTGPRARGRRVAEASAGLAVLLVVAGYGLGDERERAPRFDLREQKELVDRLVAADDLAIGFSAEEIYIFSDRSSPLPYLRLTFAPFLPLIGIPSCTHALERAVALEPQVVVVHLNRRSSGCTLRVAPFLRARGYRARRVTAGERVWEVHVRGAQSRRGSR